MITYKNSIEFIWDKGNKDKNWIKHGVTNDEAEQIFFDLDKQEYPSPKSSIKEVRKIVVGKTKKGRLLFVVYTLRNGSIRIISARDLSKRKEAGLYEKAT